MSVETLQDDATGLWGYIVYDGNRAVGTSVAVYESSKEARAEALEAIAESDTFF